jgi:hypothetical protein
MHFAKWIDDLLQIETILSVSPSLEGELGPIQDAELRQVLQKLLEE